MDIEIVCSYAQPVFYMWIEPSLSSFITYNLLLFDLFQNNFTAYSIALEYRLQRNSFSF
jgi:hypothetical protein